MRSVVEADFVALKTTFVVGWTKKCKVRIKLAPLISPGRCGGFRYDSDLQIRIDPHICNDSDLRIRIDPHICNDADLRIFTGFIKSQHLANTGLWSS